MECGHFLILQDLFLIPEKVLLAVSLIASCLSLADSPEIFSEISESWTSTKINGEYFHPDLF
jgi:hypothetical protein